MFYKVSDPNKSSGSEQKFWIRTQVLDPNKKVQIQIKRSGSSTKGIKLGPWIGQLRTEEADTVLWPRDDDALQVTEVFKVRGGRLWLQPLKEVHLLQADNVPASRI